MNEVTILKKMNHPSILKIYEFYECPNCYYIVTELCLGGELLNFLNRRQKLKEKEVKMILYQILSGIQYCHRKNIVHRDIKLENILLHRQNDISNIKIIDFGISEELKGFQLTSVEGSLHYMAPEVFKGSYDHFCDIWSIGVLFHTLLLNTMPFNAKNSRDIEHLVLNKPLDFEHEDYSMIS